MTTEINFLKNESISISRPSLKINFKNTFYDTKQVSCIHETETCLRFVTHR